MESEYRQKATRTKGWILVFLQIFALLLLSGWPPYLPQSLFAIILFCFGLLLLLYALFSMSRNSWSAHPQPSPHGTLTKKGPYKWIRHPMYTAVLVIGLVFLVSQPTLTRAVAWCLLLIVFYLKIVLEEKLLSSKYSDYRLYQQKTYRLIPGIW